MFFCVKKAIKINGKRFIPAVCYEITSYNKKEAEVLLAEGIAEQFDERIVFQNGKPLNKKKEADKTLVKQKADKSYKADKAEDVSVKEKADV